MNRRPFVSQVLHALGADRAACVVVALDSPGALQFIYHVPVLAYQVWFIYAAKQGLLL